MLSHKKTKPSITSSPPLTTSQAGRDGGALSIGRGGGTIPGWNKKADAGNMLMIIPFLLLLIIIGVGIWVGTGIFFNSNYDFRDIDAQALHDQIRFCLSDNDLDWALSESDLTSLFYKTCNINQDVVEAHLGLEIKVNDELKIKWLGDSTQCQLSELNKNFPLCKDSILTKTLNNQEIKIAILAGSNQQSRRLVA